MPICVRLVARLVCATLWMPRGGRGWLRGLALALLLLVSSLARPAGIALSLTAAHPDAPAELAGLADRAPARISGIPLDRPDGLTVDLNLQKFSVFAPDAKVTIRDAQGERVEAAPAVSHFKGEIEGHPGSTAFWSVDADGRMRGILHLDGDIFVTDTPVPGRGRMATTQSRKVDAQLDFAERKFKCDVEDGHDPVTGLELPLSPRSFAPQGNLAAALTTTPWTVRVAVDTDHEFYQLFNNSAKATQYIGDLFAYISTVYSLEVQATLQVGDVYLYSTANDPWNGTLIQESLTELKNYWVANRTNVGRALVHQLSGKYVIAGIKGLAFSDTLCSNTLGYGTVRGIDGNFTPNNPQVIWDAVAVAHEIGHNFSSPHTHCYGGIGGNANAVDGCYNQESTCYSGPTALPGVGSLSGGLPGAGAGTIMSYCHLLDPGLSNTSMTFGRNHVFGVAANRVPTRMRTGLESAVASYPACFGAYTLQVAANGPGRVIGSPAGIDCGGDCSENYPPGTSTTVTLTATPDAGYSFRSWSGDCTGAGSCTLSMNASRSVTANFDDNFPPNGTMPSGWFQPAGSSAPWAVATDSTYGGVYSLKSGLIANSQRTEISYTGQFLPGSVRFALRASSEQGYDYLRFYVDGVKQGEWSGTVAWQVVSFPVVAGVHTIRWAYEKDGSTSADSDAAWIDDVRLPLSLTESVLLVDKSGAGTVTSSPAGIDCGSDCSEVYPSGTSVTLTATPAAGYVLAGWSGDCTGTGNCTLSMNATRSATASFTRPDDGFPPNGAMPAGWFQPAGSSAPWTVATDSTYAGIYSLKSGPISNSQRSEISYTGPFLPGSVHFALRASSEATFDYLRFYIDDVTQGEWSGDAAWQVVSFPIAAGVHTIRWAYEKDATASEGSDTAWIDDVRLPLLPPGDVLFVEKTGSGTVTSTPAGIDCGSDCFEVYPSGTSVTLSAMPAPGFVFDGWAGLCTGAGICTVSVSGAQGVTATFSMDPTFDDGFPPNGIMPAGWVEAAGSSGPWTVVADSTFFGPHSLKSGVMTDSQNTGISYTRQFTAGSVQFALRVSSEANFDFLRFYVDGVKQGEWSGDVPWQVVEFPIAAGTHTLVWSYEKDNSYSEGGDAAWLDYVSLPLPPASVVVVSSANPTVTGQGVTFTATVGAATPTGTVTFKDGASVLCNAVALAGGQAACATGALMAGSHSITAVYSGDANNGGNTSTPLMQTVNKASTTAAIAAHTPNPSTVGAPIAVSAGVTVSAPGAGTPGGTLTVSDGNAICLIALPASSCNLTPVSAGPKTLTATYGGDANFNGSTSAGVGHTVDATTGGAPPVLQGVVSRKVHGAAGTFNLPLSLVSTTPATEPRTGPVQTLVFTFDKAVTAGSATVTSGVATAGAPTFNGNEMTVPLTGVANQQYVTVTVANVTASDGGTGGSGSVRVGFLLGDVNQNRAVTLSDLGQVNAQIAQPVTAANYLKDVNASGTLSLADKGMTNTQLTKTLPGP